MYDFDSLCIKSSKLKSSSAIKAFRLLLRVRSYYLLFTFYFQMYATLNFATVPPAISCFFGARKKWQLMAGSATYGRLRQLMTYLL